MKNDENIDIISKTETTPIITLKKVGSLHDYKMQLDSTLTERERERERCITSNLVLPPFRHDS